MLKAYTKVFNTIKTCKSKEHIKVSKKMIFLFFRKYNNFYYRDLLKDALDLKKRDFIWCYEN